MIYNFVYRCTMCNKLIGGRYQVGIIRPFNVYIPCPNCYAIAKLQIDCGTDYESIEIKCLENSELIHNYEVDKEKMESVADYHIEISSEFPTKNSTDSTNKKDYTPWLRMADLIRKPETLTDDISLLQKERESSKSKITRIKQFTELYKNNKLAVLSSQLDHEFASDEGVEVRTRYLSVLDDYFSAFTIYKSQAIVNSTVYNMIKNVVYSNKDISTLKNALNNSTYIKFNFNKIIDTLINFVEHYDMFYPLIVTDLFKNNPDEKFFADNILLTADPSQTYELYKKCYEVICNSIDVVIALYGMRKMPLNKIQIKVCFHENASFYPIKKSFSSNKSLDAKAKIGACKDLELEKYLPNICMLDNELRNPDAHESWNYNNELKLYENSKGDILETTIKIAYYDYKLYDLLLFLFDFYKLIIESFHLAEF